jgi:cyclopropane-fatty-acyl-phospholipid synthase
MAQASDIRVLHEQPQGDLREREGRAYGGSAEGIRSHYDVSNDFWPLVLGPTMTYSSALFESPGDSLDDAQNRKISWHLNASGAPTATSALDVGCGWGSVLDAFSKIPSIQRSVGLTLSDAQADYLRQRAIPRAEIRVENWADHQPVAPYDSIISVGALEHFAKREESRDEKISVYRDFFARCARWLRPTGRMSLQTIAFGNMKREDASDFMNNEIFPESDLPFLDELIEAMSGLFEVVAIRNDRLHYARTYDRWANNLRKNRERAAQIVGEEHVEKTMRYFKLTSVGFRMGKQHLLRFALRPLVRDWAVTGADYWGTRA